MDKIIAGFLDNVGLSPLTLASKGQGTGAFKGSFVKKPVNVSFLLMHSARIGTLLESNSIAEEVQELIDNHDFLPAGYASPGQLALGQAAPVADPNLLSRSECFLICYLYATFIHGILYRSDISMLMQSVFRSVSTLPTVLGKDSAACDVAAVDNISRIAHAVYRDVNLDAIFAEHPKYTQFGKFIVAYKLCVYAYTVKRKPSIEAIFKLLEDDIPIVLVVAYLAANHLSDITQPS